MDDNLTFGERIALLRKRKGLSQTEVAKLTKSSREAIGKYERGESIPNVFTSKSIADALGISLDELVKGYKTNGNRK
jgi:transcriptional regulator with XRE-family HTH domain